MLPNTQVFAALKKQKSIKNPNLSIYRQTLIKTVAKDDYLFKFDAREKFNPQ